MHKTTSSADAHNLASLRCPFQTLSKGLWTYEPLSYPVIILGDSGGLSPKIAPPTPGSCSTFDTTLSYTWNSITPTSFKWMFD